MIRIALISDIHIGPPGYNKGIKRKLTDYSEQAIIEFVSQVSSGNEFAFVVQLGDLIEDTNNEVDRDNFQRGLALFEPLSVPTYHLIGNHDTLNMDLDSVCMLLGYSTPYYSFDYEGFHFVFLHSFVPEPGVPGITIPGKEIEWLSADLAGTEKPVIVFMHHSLADQNLEGNPWFENHPRGCLVENRVEVREILKKAGNVAAVINGHLHWNNITHHDGIPYITIQSAVENVQETGIPARAWGVITLDSEEFSLAVLGNDAARYVQRRNTSKQ